MEVKAATKGDIQELQVYLNNGGDVNASQSWGRTLLLIAADSNQLEAVKFLLKNGADPELIAPNGRTALISATIRGRLNIVKYLLDYGANINGTGNSGSTALHYGASYDKSKIVKLLLENGADYRIQNHFHFDPLLSALKDSADENKGLTKSAQLLINVNRLMDMNNHRIEEIAFISAASGNIEVLNILVQYGFDLTTKDIWRNSLLFPAIDHSQMLSYLLRNGLYIDDINFDGDTALFAALDSGNIDSITLLLNFHADPDNRNRKGKTVLLEAADSERPDIIRLLMIAGANLYKTDSEGNTALHIAANNGDPESVRLLLIAGIDPNQKNIYGETPLKLADSNEEYREIIIELLISAGAK